MNIFNLFGFCEKLLRMKQKHLMHGIRRKMGD